MTNEEAAIKIAEELAVKEANSIALLTRKSIIESFLTYCLEEDDYDPDIIEELHKTLNTYLK